MKTGIELITEERERQINAEGYTPEHDDEHVNGEIAAAAGCYALSNWSLTDCERLWPWSAESWKPSDSRERSLAKAGALIVAEIDRLHRIPVKKDRCPTCGDHVVSIFRHVDGCPNENWQ